MESELEKALNQLIDTLVDLRVENKVLWAHFTYYKKSLPPKAELLEMIEKAKSDPAVVVPIRESYAESRSRFHDSLNLEEAIRTLLQVFPTDKNTN
jgi:hypothetical protein